MPFIRNAVICCMQAAPKGQAQLSQPYLLSLKIKKIKRRLAPAFFICGSVLFTRFDDPNRTVKNRIIFTNGETSSGVTVWPSSRRRRMLQPSFRTFSIRGGLTIPAGRNRTSCVVVKCDCESHDYKSKRSAFNTFGQADSLLRYAFRLETHRFCLLAHLSKPDSHFL